MKLLINKKLYDTHTADLIHSWSNGIYGNDFRFCEESLYLTKKGAWFLVGEGGPKSKYARSCDSSMTGGRELIVLTPEEAYLWLEDNGGIEAIEKYFPQEIEAA